MRDTNCWWEKQVMSVPEVCCVLGISRSLGFKMIHRGELPFIRLGEKRIVVPTAAVVQILNQSKEAK